MRRRSGHLFIVSYSSRDNVLGFPGWIPEGELRRKGIDLDRENRWDGFVPFHRGIESPEDRARLSKHVGAGRPLAEFEQAEPGPVQVFPRVACGSHGTTRIRFLECSGCGHVEDIEADLHGPPVMECPGGCGAPFTPLAHPSDFTARALCLVCGLAATTRQPHAEA